MQSVYTILLLIVSNIFMTCALVWSFEDEATIQLV